MRKFRDDPKSKRMNSTTNLLIALIFIILSNSCLERQFIEGRSEIISVSDTAINDSTIIYGHVYHTEFPEIISYEDEFEIWIENTDIITTNKTGGEYLIKTIPGNYTLKCQSRYNNWEQLVEEIKNLELLENKKIEIDFYIGYTIE